LHSAEALKKIPIRQTISLIRSVVLHEEEGGEEEEEQEVLL
jgi:hypothetical protein